MVNYKQKTEHNKIIGQKSQEYYCLDYTFEHNDGMKGATGTILRAITQEEYHQRMDKWRNPNAHHPMHHVWTQKVKDGETLKGFKQWIDEMPQHEKERAEFDPSGNINLREKIRELEEDKGKDIRIIECIGGGRCVDKPREWYDETVNPELIEEIKKYEEVEK